jgi:hypothetical protein
LWNKKLCQPVDIYFFSRNPLASGHSGKIIHYRASMFDSVFWSILFYSALVCIIATILCSLAPLAVWQTFFAWFSLAMPDGLYEFRLSLILDMKKIPDHMVFWICLKYALRFFVLYGREIVLSVTVIYFFPVIKSKYSSAYRRHRRTFQLCSHHIALSFEVAHLSNLLTIRCFDQIPAKLDYRCFRKCHAFSVFGRLRAS